MLRTARSAAASESPSSVDMKKQTSRDGLLEVAVAWDDVEHDAARHRVGGGGDEERLGWSVEAGERLGRRVHAAAGDGFLQEGADVQGG